VPIARGKSRRDLLCPAANGPPSVADIDHGHCSNNQKECTGCIRIVNLTRLDRSIAPGLIESRTSPAATGASRPMLHFKWMRNRDRVRTYLCLIAAALRADPLLGLAATGEDHAAKAMTTAGTQELVDRHRVVLTRGPRLKAPGCGRVRRVKRPSWPTPRALTRSLALGRAASRWRCSAAAGSNHSQW
jgi:hypothetical protein